MTSTVPIRVKWFEDGTATVLARLTARDGTGEWTGVVGEGNFLKAADISTITYATYDRSSTTPDTAIASGSLTVATVVQDIPVKDRKIWDVDEYGYNFIHDIPVTAFPTGGNTVRVEYKITTTGSTVGWGVFEGPVIPVVTS